MTSDIAGPRDVVTNVAVVLKTFLDRMKEDMPEAHWVYDEQLSYETALKTFRANQEQKGTKEQFLPAFVFRRGVIRWSEEGAGRRMTTVKFLGPVSEQTGKRTAYRGFIGELPISFMFITSGIKGAEGFELSYLGGAGVAGNVMMTSEMPDLGDFPYACRFSALDDLVIQLEQNYFKAVLGQVVIRGAFLIFEGESSIITKINHITETFLREVLAEGTITGI